MSNNEIELITQLKNSVDFIGVDKTINALKSAQLQYFPEEKIKDIITVICKEVGISVRQFRDSSLKNNDKRKVAICFCIHFLHSYNYFNFSYDEIADKLPGLNLNGRQSIYYYVRIIKTAKTEDPKSDIDKLIANHLPKLEKTIKPFTNHTK